MPNYPASLDSAIHPGPGTFRDDPGFELDVLVSELMDRTVALETKLGITASTAAAGTVLRGTSAGASAFGVIQGSDLATGLVARKNRLINGNFSVWQRGNVNPTTTDNQYGADRWRYLTEAAPGQAGSIIESSDLPSAGSRYAVRIQCAANQKAGYFSPLESRDSWDLRGGPASLQFKAKVNDPRLGILKAAICAWTGGEDSVAADPIANWNAEGTNPALSGSWAYCGAAPTNLGVATSWVTYKLENISIPSPAFNLGVFIWGDDKSLNANDSIYVTDVQLEKGSTCTDIERRPFADELALCLRYYQKSYDYSVVPGSNASTGMVQTQCDGFSTNQIPGPRWHLPMRALPTATIWSKVGTPGTTSNVSYADSGGSSCVVSDISTAGARCVVAGAGAWTASTAYNYHWRADAEL
jgi:hypothetical protein